MSDNQNPLGLGVSTLWTPKSDEESRRRYDEFFGTQEDMEGPLQVAGDWQFTRPEERAAMIAKGLLGAPGPEDLTYFEKGEPDDAHKRVYYCTNAFKEFINKSDQENFDKGWGFVYVSALAPNEGMGGDPVSDDRVLVWRHVSPEAHVVEECKAVWNDPYKYLDLTSAQWFDQMITWCEERNLNSLSDLNFVLESFQADHEDILNFCRNFKPFRQGVWGSWDVHEPARGQ